MDKRQRITLLAIAAAIAAVAIVVALAAGGGDDESADTAATTQATETQQQQQTTTEAEPEPPEPEPTQIRVKGGEPVGGAADIDVSKDDTVEIEVRADAADEAHLHGYDVTKEVGPGKTARFRFKADIEGVFELELHNSGGQLAKITVKP